MDTFKGIGDCRYCSEVSKANGEDPIGSAPQVDHWLLVEVKQPWPISMFEEHPIIAQVISIVEKLIFRRGITIMPTAIAPDPDYSIPGMTRVIYYHRPAQQFAKYSKREYLLPEAQASQLIFALLNRLFGKTTNLSQFEAYQQDTHHVREMLVCTHTQVDLACGRFGTPLYRQLRKTYGQPGQSLRVWQSTHFGGHQFAPTLVDLPVGQFWGHLESEVLPLLVEQDSDHQQMQKFYRGWAGCNKFEQIAERAIWEQQGWSWFTYPRRCRTTQKGLTGFKKLLYPILRRIPIALLQLWLEDWTADATWAKINLTYQSPQGNSAHQVTVDEHGEVLSAHNSVAEKDETISVASVKQYRVSYMAKKN